jgi:hypothetical protein
MLILQRYADGKERDDDHQPIGPGWVDALSSNVIPDPAHWARTFPAGTGAWRVVERPELPDVEVWRSPDATAKPAPAP